MYRQNTLLWLFCHHGALDDGGFNGFGCGVAGFCKFEMMRSKGRGRGRDQTKCGQERR